MEKKVMNVNVSKLAPYAKAVVAVGGLVVLVAKALVDGVLTGDEMAAIGIAVAVALGVYKVPNKG